MSRKKMVALGGKEFEEYNYLYTPGIHTRRSLSDVYKKPSELKEAIYNDWIEWFSYCSESCSDFLTIDSYSKQSFRLSGMVTINGERYVIKVTPSRNYCANWTGYKQCNGGETNDR